MQIIHPWRVLLLLEMNSFHILRKLFIGPWDLTSNPQNNIIDCSRVRTRCHSACNGCAQNIFLSLLNANKRKFSTKKSCFILNWRCEGGNRERKWSQVTSTFLGSKVQGPWKLGVNKFSAKISFPHRLVSFILSIENYDE